MCLRDTQKDDLVNSAIALSNKPSKISYLSLRSLRLRKEAIARSEVIKQYIRKIKS
jgi:hypothetical protein